MRPISVTYSQLSRILWDRRRTVAFPIVIAFILAIFFVKLSPKTYTAFCDVLLDAKSSDPLLGVQLAMSSSYLTTQIDIIRSERVAKAAAKAANLGSNKEVQSEWELSETTLPKEVWLARWVAKGLRVTPSKDSGVISIGFVSKDPKFAAYMANALANAYVQTSLELRLAPTQLNATFFDASARAARAEVERAQTALSGFQRSHSMVSIRDSLDIESARLAELSSTLVTVEGTSAENQSRSSAANQRGVETLQEVLTNASVQALKGEVGRLERQLLELQTRLGPQHPQVKSAQVELAGARSRLASETSRVAASISTSGTAIRQRESQARSALEAQKVKILQLRSLRDEAEVLSRDVEAAQRQLDRANDRSSQSALESQYKLTNVSVLSDATQPDRPSAPQSLLITVILLVVGSILGVVSAVGLELRNRKVRSPEELVQILQVPVLTVLGDFRKSEAQKLLSFEVPFVKLR